MSNNIPGFSPPGPAGVFVPPTMPQNPEAGKLNITPEMKVQKDAFWGNYEKSVDMRRDASGADMRRGEARMPPPPPSGGFFGGLFAGLSNFLGGIAGPAIKIISGGWASAASDFASGIISSVFGKKS